MIPRILHRIWFGSKPPNDVYLASWRTHCPDWSIRTWTDADVAQFDSRYLREALAAQKWAFASDYVRLAALYREGGFYLDTDVELTSSVEPYRANGFCVGMTRRQFPQTAVIGAEPKNAIIGEILATYEGARFDFGEGVYDEHPINHRFRDVLSRHGVDFASLDCEVELNPEPGIWLYPYSLFCRRVEGKQNFAIHHAEGTWQDPWKRMNVLRLPLGWRLIRMKHRKVFSETAPYNLLRNEHKVVSFRVRRFAFVLAHQKESL